MLKRYARVVAAALFGVDLALTIGAFLGAYALLSRDLVPGAPRGLAEFDRYFWLLLLIVPLWTFLLHTGGVYAASRRTEDLRREMGQVVRAVFLGGIGLAAALALTKSGHISRSFVGWFLLLDAAALCLYRVGLRLAARSVRRTGCNFRSVVIVGTGENARDLGRRIASNSHWGLRLLGYVSEDERKVSGMGPVLGSISDLPRLLCREVVDEVLVAVSPERIADLKPVFLHCEEVGMNVRLAVDFLPRRLARVELEDLEGAPLLTFRTTPREDWGLAAKRAIDLVGSGLFLAVFGWLYALTAILIKLTSRGPVLYRQERVGLHGRRFTMYKFRSMVADADLRRGEVAHLNEMDGPIFKSSRDPRVTGVGRLLRKFSLDELPQMWNVFRGDMSLVGPRPPLPYEVEKYESWARRRLSVRPGLTCLWQVEGRGRIGYRQWVEMDLAYIDSWTLALDLKILLKTVPAVLSGRGAC